MEIITRSEWFRKINFIISMILRKFGVGYGDHSRVSGIAPKPCIAVRPNGDDEPKQSEAVTSVAADARLGDEPVGSRDGSLTLT